MISNLTNKMSDICRLCLQTGKQEDSTNIFDSNNLESFKIQLLIRDLCSIKLMENDSLPKCICNECKLKLFSIHQFITLCKESDNKLHKMYGSMPKPNEDNHHNNVEENDSKLSRKFEYNTSSDVHYPMVTIKQEAVEIDKDVPEYPVSTMLAVYEDDHMEEDSQQNEASRRCTSRNVKNHYQNRPNDHYSRNPYPTDQKNFIAEEIARNAAYQQTLWNNATSLQNEDLNYRYGEEVPDEAQLFGKDWPGEEMVLLHDDIYCRKSIYDAAHTASHKASHVARRLISGVFKPEAIRRCTLTGQTPRTLGKERLNDKVDCLHVAARNAIIDYSRRLAEERGWKLQSIQELKHALSQRLGELKREMKSMELHQVNCIKLHTYYNSQMNSQINSQINSQVNSQVNSPT